ncbi:MAG: N-acetylglucosamine-6-phosphate deacetylase [Lentisphaeria bacterium]|nr:N-acetylglucosamine-6-phosphate deacetylase [Lentisphaeria bacterium]
MINHGWVDLQVNGHRGVDYSDPELTRDMILRSIEELLATGTAMFLPTIVTGDLRKNVRNALMIREVVEANGLRDHVPGVHFEGPFISPVPGAVGAHDPKYVVPPTAENIAALIDPCGDWVKIITVAADADGAAEAIAALKERGVAVSVGHHMATTAQVRSAADAGAKLLTHLGNGCPNLLDRHRNPFYAGLAEDRLTAMIITDGHHLPGELIKIILRVKGTDRLIVTSDASSVTGFPPGDYSTLGNKAILYPDGKLYNPDKQCLVGSASTISDCMNFLASLDILTDAELKKVGRDNALAVLGMK